MKKGFTLIELLIVIAIIGVLAGIILLNTSSTRQKANDAKFKSYASGLRSTLAMACVDSTGTTANLTAVADPVVLDPSLASTTTDLTNYDCSGDPGIFLTNAIVGSSPACTGAVVYQSSADFKNGANVCP